MFIISYALIGDLLSNFLMIIGGAYCILLFGGYMKPKHRDEAQRQKFEVYKEKWGSFMVFTGCLLILLGTIQILFSLGFFDFTL